MRLAVLSYHTSPLAQPGAGDGGGMNVYVRELCSALARAGLDCDVYTRAWRRGLPPVVAVEAGFRVHHVVAGPTAPVARRVMPELVGQFTEGVLRRIQEQRRRARAAPRSGEHRARAAPRSGEHRAHGPDLIHANYWLSGVAGHALKHELELPLVSTFHTLARVKAEANPQEHEQRARSEAEVIGCSDVILASSTHERAELECLYAAVPGRVETVPPGVDHELFSPGDRASARAALGLGDHPVLLFVGRLQPLKGAAVAIEALALLSNAAGAGGSCAPRSVGPAAPMLMVVGGPSGPEGQAELRRLHALVGSRGLERAVRFVPPQPHERLATYYRAADVCLVPSHSESFGLVALEAAACGTPVIAASVGGLLTLVDHTRTGFLIEGRDPATFAARARELLDDQRLAAEMGTVAARGARRYSWSITAARLRRLYADLAERRLVECR